MNGLWINERVSVQKDQKEIASILKHHGATHAQATVWSRYFKKIVERTRVAGVLLAISAGTGAIYAYRLMEKDGQIEYMRLSPEKSEEVSAVPSGPEKQSDTRWEYYLGAIVALAAFATYVLLRKRKVVK